MWPRAILLSKKRFNLNHTQCCRLPRFQTQHSFLICALQNQCTLFPMVLRRALINKISLPIHLLNLIIIHPPLFPPPSTDIILSAYSRVLNCRKHHLCKKSVLVSFGEGRQGKGHGHGRELKNVSKWSRVQENHHSLCEEATCAKYSLLSLWLKNKQKDSLGMTLESVLLFKMSLGKTAVTLAHSCQTATWPKWVSTATGVAGADHRVGRREQNE